MRFDLAPAQARDLVHIQSLLLAASLPIAGVDDQFPEAYVVACVEGSVVGAAGLERHGAAGLLRSVVVDEAYRGAGIGRALVTDRLAWARSQQIGDVFLLTTTASVYFEKLGFESVARSAAPRELALSPEFAGACPASALCFLLTLC